MNGAHCTQITKLLFSNSSIRYLFDSRICKPPNSKITKKFANQIVQRNFCSPTFDAKTAPFKDFIEFSAPEKYSVIPKGFNMFPNFLPSHEQDFIVNEVEAELATNRYAKWNEFHRR